MRNSKRDFHPTRTRQDVLRKLIPLGILSLGIAGIAFIIEVLFFPAFSWLTGSAGGRTDWTLLEGYTGLFTLALVIGGLVFAMIEYIRTEVEQARENAQISFSIYQALHARLTDPEEEAARRWIFLNITPKQPDQPEGEWLEAVQGLIQDKPEAWDKSLSPGQEHIKRVLNTFDFMGFIAENYWTVEGPLLEWMSPPITKVWERIGLYVEKEAKRRKEPDFYKSARFIGERCIQWRKETNLPTAEIVSDTV